MNRDFQGRKCSHCGYNGHNSRTCHGKGVFKLFGVKINLGGGWKGISRWIIIIYGNNQKVKKLGKQSCDFYFVGCGNLERDIQILQMQWVGFREMIIVLLLVTSGLVNCDEGPFTPAHKKATLDRIKSDAESDDIEYMGWFWFWACKI